MKRIASIAVGVAFLLGMYGASAQSLGDVARSVRKSKTHQNQAARHFDNDNLPTSDHLSVVGPEPAAATKTGNAEVADAGKAAPETAKQDAADQNAPSATSLSADDKSADWKKKIQEQRNRVETLSKELDITQREYRLRAVAMYSDAGNRLRNSTQWDKEDAQYKQDIATQQKDLGAAKQALNDMMDDARKAGVSLGDLK